MNDEVFELPKIKSEYIIDSNIYDDQLNKVLDLGPKRKINYFICIFFLLCAFLKIGEQNFDKFFFYALKYMFRKKRFVYVRCCKW